MSAVRVRQAAHATVAGVAVLVLVVVSLVTFSAFVEDEAQAGILCDLQGTCGSLKHGADEGYDAPIYVRCNYGDSDSNRLVYEGNSDPCHDVDQVGVRANEEVWCKSAVVARDTYERTFDAEGWHKVNDLWNKMCVVHRD